MVQWYPLLFPGLSVHPSVYQPTSRSNHLSVCLSAHLCVIWRQCRIVPAFFGLFQKMEPLCENCLYSPVCPSIRRSVCLPVDLTFCLSVPLSFFSFGAGNTNRSERQGTVDFLIKLACFVKAEIYVSNIKNSWSELAQVVQGDQLYWAFPSSKGSLFGGCAWLLHPAHRIHNT